MLMIRKHLRLRLERLEQAVLSIEDEPTRVEVYYSDLDGTEELAYVVDFPPHRFGTPRPIGITTQMSTGERR
jgi:hypothetical protein